jgi:hypothetical protein
LLALDPLLVAELGCWVVVACADPGRLTATPAAVTTLASPAAAVIARILTRLRSLAAICRARLVGRGWTGSDDMAAFLSGLMTPDWLACF